MKTMTFLERNRKLLDGLRGQVEAIRRGRKIPEDFYRLGKSMEAYRDFVRVFLDSLPVGERGAVEDQLSPAIFPLVEEASKLADQAHETGIIDEHLAHDIGVLGNCLRFVSVQSRIVVETPERLKPHRSRAPGFFPWKG